MPSLRPGEPRAIFRADPQRTGAFPVRGARRLPARRWSFRAPGPIDAPPVSDGETVYLGTRAGTAHALDLRTGEEQWIFRADGALRAPLQRDGARVVLAAESHASLRFHVLDALRGEELARPPAVRIRGGAAWFLVLGNMIYLADGRAARAFSLSSGEERWSHEGEFLEPCPAAAGDRVLFVESGSHQGYSLYALDRGTGEECWSYDGMPNGDPILSGEIVLTAENGGGVLGLALEDGRVLWSWMTGSDNPEGADGDDDVTERPCEFCTNDSPAVSGDSLYVGGGSDLGEICVAVDRATRRERWIRRVDGILRGAPALAGETVYWATQEGSVIGLDSRSGEQLFRMAVKSGLWAPVDRGLIIAEDDELTMLLDR